MAGNTRGQMAPAQHFKESSVQTKFTNELGNEISIDVGLKMRADQIEKVWFIIKGPDSTTETTLTMKEARELHRLLSDIFCAPREADIRDGVFNLKN